MRAAACWFWGSGLVAATVVAGVLRVDATVILGNEVLRNSKYADLQGRRVAVLSNPTGVFQDTLRHIVDDLHAEPSVNLVAVLSPEHGFRGDHQAETGDPVAYRDPATGLPVISAYKLSPAALSDALSRLKVDCIIADLQDVGVRLYTFVWTMYGAMQAAAEMSRSSPVPLRFVVADRPNPLGGVIVDGPMLNTSCCASGYGELPIPHLHGMTIGELAVFFNAHLDARLDDLRVVRMEGWQRSMGWDDTGLAWVPPSPNLPTSLSSVAYADTVFIEATTVAEGRGTTTPFTLLGAPFLDAASLTAGLNERAGGTQARFREAYFEPSFSKYNGTVCQGVQWVRRVEASFALAVEILQQLRAFSSPPSAFAWDGSWFGHPGNELIDLYAGTPLLRQMLDAQASTRDIVEAFRRQTAMFVEKREPFLLYT